MEKVETMAAVLVLSVLLAGCNTTPLVNTRNSSADLSSDRAECASMVDRSYPMVAPEKPVEIVPEVITRCTGGKNYLNCTTTQEISPDQRLQADSQKYSQGMRQALQNMRRSGRINECLKGRGWQ